MNAKDKAKELVLKMHRVDSIQGIRYLTLYEAKKCALIAVDEIIDFTKNKCCEFQNSNYWQEVKTEIQKL